MISLNLYHLMFSLYDLIYLFGFHEKAFRVKKWRKKKKKNLDSDFYGDEPKHHKFLDNKINKLVKILMLIPKFK